MKHKKYIQHNKQSNQKKKKKSFWGKQSSIDTQLPKYQKKNHKFSLNSKHNTQLPKYPKKSPQILTFFVKLTAQTKREKNEQHRAIDKLDLEEQHRQKEKTEQQQHRQALTSTDMAENQPDLRQTWPTKKKKGRKEKRKSSSIPLELGQS